VELAPGTARRTLHIPTRALAQALRAVVKNAIEASPPRSPVRIRIEDIDGAAQIEISDHGQGMTPEVLTRATEPFFTTKEPGRGMGLGLFLAHAVIDRVGGQMTIESAVSRGTRVKIVLPWSEAESPATGMAVGFA
jgi:two-component system, sensor histidine kinase RegB